MVINRERNIRDMKSQQWKTNSLRHTFLDLFSPLTQRFPQAIEALVA